MLGSVRKAWLHADLERRFVELERYLSAGPESAALVSEGWDRRLAIEVDEPPVLKVLDAMCHNELLRSERYPKEAQVPISVWQRFFAHWFDFQEHTIQPCMELPITLCFIDVTFDIKQRGSAQIGRASVPKVPCATARWPANVGTQT